MADTEERVGTTAVDQSISTGSKPDQGHSKGNNKGHNGAQQDSSHQQSTDGKRRRPDLGESGASPTSRSPRPPDTDNARGTTDKDSSDAPSSSGPLKRLFCPCCSMGHATPEELIQHVKQFPVKLETFSCSICLLEFFLRSDLLDHQRLDHQLASCNVFKCDECDLDYTSQAQLTRHKKMHEEIARKLAACGVFLPRTKKTEPPPSTENASSAAPPCRYPQASSSSAQPDTQTDAQSDAQTDTQSDAQCDTQPAFEDTGGAEEQVKEEVGDPEDCGAAEGMEREMVSRPPVTRHKSTRARTRQDRDRDRELGVSLDTPQHRNTTQRKQRDSDTTQLRNTHRNTQREQWESDTIQVRNTHRNTQREQCDSDTTQVRNTDRKPQREQCDSDTTQVRNTHRKTQRKQCDSESDSTQVKNTDRNIQRNTRNKQGDSDEDWQAYNSSDFAASDPGDVSDDPDYRQSGRGRGMGRGWGMRKAKQKPDTPVRLREKRKCTASRMLGEASTQMEGKRAKGRGGRQQGWKGRRDNKPTANKREEETEEIEVPAHLRNKDGSIQCPDCAVICYSLRGLNRHRKFHFRTMAHLQCLLCESVFTDKAAMNTHMRQEHRLKQNRSSDAASGSQEIPCTEPNCTAVFSSSISLSKHRVRDHGVAKSQLHKCDHCGKVYGGSTELKNHRRMHTDERPFACSLCSKAYRSSGGLLWHLKTHSQKSHDVLNKFTDIKVTAEGHYACELCQKEFKSLHGIRLHKENPQKKCSAAPGYWGKWKPKPAICEVCGRKFPSKVTLKSHMVTHTGERPHKCRYCEATFKHYKNKFIHEKMHRNQKDFICNKCGKAFYDGTNLKTHIDSHKEVRDLPCQLCGKLFHVEINRRRHEKRCRNFIRCQVCQAVFRQHERLMRHVMINHHGAQVAGDWLTAQPMPQGDSVSSEAVLRQPVPQADSLRSGALVRNEALVRPPVPPADSMRNEATRSEAVLRSEALVRQPVP